MSDSNITSKTFGKKFAPRLTDSLPDFLKDPANFLKVQQAIYKTIATKHSHGDVFEYAKCSACSRKMLERRHLLKSLGFKNPAQYMQWQKTHAEIRKRFPLMDWKTRTPINLKK